MGAKATALGDYLRARREQLRPDEVGLVAGGRRRAAGLRREEVATIGDRHVHRSRISVPHSGGQHLLIYSAEPGSESARVLEELRTLSTSLPPPSPSLPRSFR